jgi:hypothetical protein
MDPRAHSPGMRQGRDTGEAHTRDGAWARFGRFLIGPRAVDTPIRVVVLIVAIWLTWPGYFEADTPAYVICQVLSAILMLAACWRPGLATAIGAVGVVAYGVMFAQ